MKAILFFSCLLVGYVLGQDPTIAAQFSGTTQGGPVFYPVNLPIVTTCSVVTNARPYVVVNYTFTTDGVRQVSMLVEPSFKTHQQVFLYNASFTPSTTTTSTSSCVNFMRALSNTNYVGDAGIAVIDEPVFFAANTVYFFVITSTDATFGRFALNIFVSAATGTTVGGPLWTPPILSNFCNITIGVSQQNLAVYSWTQPLSGNFDILVLFDFVNSNNSIYFALYPGTIPATTIAANPCTVTPLVRANEGDLSALALAQPLTINNQYTIAVSNVFPSRWGVQVRPTRLTRITAANGFPQPSRSLPCSANTTATSAGYVLYSFVAAFQTYFFDTYTIPAYKAPAWADYPTASFAYSGALTTAPTTSCPATTPLVAVAATGTKGPLVFSTTVGKTYTVFISSASGAALDISSSAAQVFIFTGQTVGNTSSYIPDNSTSTGTSTGTGTGTTTTTTGSTTNRTTTTSTSSTGAGSSTTSGGAILSPTFSFPTIVLLLVVGAVAALL